MTEKLVAPTTHKAALLRARREGRKLATEHIKLHKHLTALLADLNGPTVFDQIIEEGMGEFLFSSLSDLYKWG